jgi:hypothetical protein
LDLPGDVAMQKMVKEELLAVLIFEKSSWKDE